MCHSGKHLQTMTAVLSASCVLATSSDHTTMKGLLIPLLLTSLCQAVRVYLHPDPHVPPRLSASKAGAVLSKHLALERFEDAAPFVGEQELLIGTGLSTGLLLTVSSEDVKGAFLPDCMRRGS